MKRRYEVRAWDPERGRYLTTLSRHFFRKFAEWKVESLDRERTRNGRMTWYPYLHDTKEAQ